MSKLQSTRQAWGLRSVQFEEGVPQSNRAMCHQGQEHMRRTTLSNHKQLLWNQPRETSHRARGLTHWSPNSPTWMTDPANITVWNDEWEDDWKKMKSLLCLVFILNVLSYHGNRQISVLLFLNSPSLSLLWCFCCLVYSIQTGNIIY